jgi:hypothetical protein
MKGREGFDLFIGELGGGRKMLITRFLLAGRQLTVMRWS